MLDDVVSMFYSAKLSHYNLQFDRQDSLKLDLRPGEKFSYSYNAVPSPYQYYNATYSLVPPPPLNSIGVQ